MTEQETGTDARRLTFFTVDDEIFEFDLTPHELAVYFVIVKHIHRKTNVAFPGASTIAKAANMSRRKALDSIKVLEQRGLVSVVRGKKDDGQNAVNRYSLLDVKEAYKRRGSAHRSLPSADESLGVVHESNHNQRVFEPEDLTNLPSPESGDVSAQQPNPKTTDRIPLEDEYRAEVDAFFQLTGMADGLRFKYYHFMAGSASNKKAGDWYKLQMQPGMTLDELRAFRKWYAATSKPAMSSPETIHANAARFRVDRAKQAASAERAAAQREQARVEEEAFTPMTEAERRAVEARYADEMRGLGRRVDMIGAAS